MPADAGLSRGSSGELLGTMEGSQAKRQVALIHNLKSIDISIYSKPYEIHGGSYHRRKKIVVREMKNIAAAKVDANSKWYGSAPSCTN
jgi:hypothetical protein